MFGPTDYVLVLSLRAGSVLSYTNSLTAVESISSFDLILHKLLKTDVLSQFAATRCYYL